MAWMVELATQYGRYGYRRVTAILHGEGWKVHPKRVERLWRQEGLKVPSRQPKRRRLWALSEEIRRSEFSTGDRELGRPELTPLGKCSGAVELEIVP